jgi:AbrB family looped-hinge helix DNA binding protein
MLALEQVLARGGRDLAEHQIAIDSWGYPFENGIMTARLTLDAAGRVVLPKPLRDELNLAAGDTLELESAGERILLRPVRAAAPLVKEKGVWVFRTGQPIAAAVTEDVLRQIREERDEKNLDPKG